MHLYIVDHMYIHINSKLVFKTAKVNKELYLSSLVVSPIKEHKQDKINQFLVLFFVLTMA